MKSVWRDSISAVLAVAGGVIVFARLESYSWWLIGSWRGALGVLAVLGLGILLTNLNELIEYSDIPSFLESFLWLITATVVIASLVATTDRAEFVASAITMGVAWLAQLTRHLWRIGHHHGSHYASAH